VQSAGSERVFLPAHFFQIVGPLKKLFSFKQTIALIENFHKQLNIL